jgi:hypothetical protein
MPNAAFQQSMLRERTLKVLLLVVGLLFLGGFYSIIVLLFGSPQPAFAYEQMLASVYATLGIFLLLAARKPSAHRSLIAFTAWSSVVHAGVMALQAFRGLIPRIDLLHAVLPMLLIGVALIILLPAKQPGAHAAGV